LDITFENGVCKSYYMLRSREGEYDESKSNSPVDCSYEAIYDKLKYIGDEPGKR